MNKKVVLDGNIQVASKALLSINRLAKSELKEAYLNDSPVSLSDVVSVADHSHDLSTIDSGGYVSVADPMDIPPSMRNMMFVLDEDNNVVEAKTMREWGEFLQSPRRQVFKNDFGKDIHLSTMFIGMNRHFTKTPRGVFETMIFGGALDGSQMHSDTYEEAEETHKMMYSQIIKELENSDLPF